MLNSAIDHVSEYSKLARQLGGCSPRQVSLHESSQPLHVETDYYLAKVRENRPTYEAKTGSHRPMSTGHLMSLVSSAPIDDGLYHSPVHVAKDIQEPYVSSRRVENTFYRWTPADNPAFSQSARVRRSPTPTARGDKGFMNPRAIGLAPTPTDQPVTRPMRSGPEGNVDKATVEMMRNVETGYGAAGEYVCAACRLGISEGRKGCSALGQTYHLECFTCCKCHCQLAGGSFYAVDGMPYCERDYINSLEKCCICNKAITDRILRASGRPFHPSCFRCTQCMNCLDGVPFTVDSHNDIHCVPCFQNKYAPRCARCGQAIVPDSGLDHSTRIVAMDKSFHVNCYKCQDCGRSLSSKIEGSGCYPLGDTLLCKQCHIARINTR